MDYVHSLAMTASNAKKIGSSQRSQESQGFMTGCWITYPERVWCAGEVPSQFELYEVLQQCWANRRR